MKKYTFIFLFVLALIFGGSGVNTVDADSHGTSLGGPVQVQNPLTASTVAGLFQDIIDIIMVFAVPIIVFFIVYAGFLYVTARGNQETIQKAHKALLYAIIGGLLIIGANVLINVVGGTVTAVTN